MPLHIVNIYIYIYNFEKTSFKSIFWLNNKIKKYYIYLIDKN